MRGAARRGPEPRVVATFASTFDALEAERLCQAAGVPGRIIPLPATIAADCGLAWSMPVAPEVSAAFEAALAGRVVPAARITLML